MSDTRKKVFDEPRRFWHALRPYTKRSLSRYARHSARAEMRSAIKRMEGQGGLIEAFRPICR